MDDAMRAANLAQLGRGADVFTDRISSSKSFATALRRHASDLASGATGHDLPRHNVVCFHGMGGIGKTELLLRFGQWIAGDDALRELWGPPPVATRDERRRVHYGRFDLRDRWDVDRVLLRLRALAAEAGIRSSAFDVGLLARWTLMRPGEEMPRIGRRSGGDLRGLIEQSAAAALSAVNVKLGAGWVAKLLTEQAWHAVEERRRSETIAACPALPEVLRDIKEQRNELSATAIARLLDWDISMLSPPERPVCVAFVDAYEAAQRAGRHTEELIQRVVFWTPHLQWIVAGHDRLAWAEAAGRLSFGGAAHWPTLAAGQDSSQHRLDMLSREDADEFLRRILVDEDGGPFLSDATRAKIVSASDGLPLYLHLSFQHALRLLADGEALTPDRFGEPLDGLIEHVAAGLPDDERRALNAAVLVRTFDAELVATGAAVDEAAAERFLERPMVSESPESADGHQLHDIVRRTVRVAEATSPGGWARADWGAAGTRMLSLLQDRCRAAEDADTQLGVALTAFDVAADPDVEVRPDWVLTALIEHPSRARVAQQVIGRVREHADIWTASVEQLLGCWLKTEGAPPLADRLGAVAADPGLSDDVRLRAGRHRAYRLRTLGDHRATDQEFARLRRMPGGDTPLLWFQHGLTLMHLGRFPEAERLKTRLEDVGEESKADRLAGELSLQHGHLTAAAEATARRAEDQRAQNNFHNAMEVQVAHARRLALIEAGRLDVIEDAIELTKHHLAIGHLRSALCSKALCLAGDASAVAELITECRYWTGTVGAPAVTGHEALALTFDAAVRNDPEAMAAARLLMQSHERARDPRWARPIAWWQHWVLGEPPPRYDDVEWLEPEDLVRDRWLDLVRRRRDER